MPLFEDFFTRGTSYRVIPSQGTASTRCLVFIFHRGVGEEHLFLLCELFWRLFMRRVCAYIFTPRFIGVGLRVVVVPALRQVLAAGWPGRASYVAAPQPKCEEYIIPLLLV